jgi:hypothetical protein
MSLFARKDDRRCMDALRASEGALCESLEQRALLAGTPFPDIGLMVNPDNTVVRYEIHFGGQVFDVDIELFDVAGPNGSAGAPRTVANFIDYLESGRFDESFIHRSADDANFPIDFVVQGGGFLFDDEDGLAPIDEDEPISNEFDAGRSNIERTIAGDQPVVFQHGGQFLPRQPAVRCFRQGDHRRRLGRH